MQHRIAICVGLSALGVALSESAQAQVYVGPPPVYAPPPRIYVAPPVHAPGLPPGEVLIRVRAAGLTPLTRPARRGGVYLVLASDRMGGQLRVVVNAYNGRIMRAVPAHDPRFAYQPARPPAAIPGAPPPPAPRVHAARPELKDPPPGTRTRRWAGPAANAAPPAPRTGETDNPRLAGAPPAIDPAPRRSAKTPMPRPRPAAAGDTARADHRPGQTHDDTAHRDQARPGRAARLARSPAVLRFERAP
jgi:hypothetical protein